MEQAMAMAMASLREWVAGITPEPIEAVIFGEYGWGESASPQDSPDDDDPDPTRMPPQLGHVYRPEDAARWLDRRFDSGYGAPETYAVAVYTESWVISVAQYDGSTRPFALRRNPAEGFVPDMPGG